MKKLIFSVFILSVSTILPLSGRCAALNSVSDTLGNTFVSAVCTHTVSFSSPNTAVIGRISIAFDPGFGISSILQGTVTGLNSGTLSVTGDTVIYTVISPLSRLPIGTKRGDPLGTPILMSLRARQ